MSIETNQASGSWRSRRHSWARTPPSATSIFLQLLLFEELLPGGHDVLVDLLDLKHTDKRGFPCVGPSEPPPPTDLQGLLDAVSEERGLVLAVVKQDVEGDVAPHHVVDGGLDHAVEVSDGVGLVQHVVDLQVDKNVPVIGAGTLRERWFPAGYLVLFAQQLQWIHFDL